MFYRRGLDLILSTRHETERTRVEARDSEMYTCEWTLDSDGLPVISALIGPPGLTLCMRGDELCEGGTPR